MWIFLPFGFLSVVQHRDKPDTVLVRARAEQDLEAFRARGHCPSMTDTKYLEWADYPYRAEVLKVEFAQAMFEISMTMDWTNFKSAVGHAPGDERSGVYMDIWCKMKDAQDSGRLGDPKTKRQRSWNVSPLPWKPTKIKSMPMLEPVGHRAASVEATYLQPSVPRKALEDPFYWSDDIPTFDEEQNELEAQQERDGLLEFDDVDDMIDHFSGRKGS